jgi:putative ABC transport system permease protein
LLALPLNGVTTAIGNGNFAEMAFGFQVTPQIMLTGVIFAVILGSIGGMFPARSASRKEILTALREG